ncbi:MAG: glycosyltransferase [Bacteroidales bacterium]|nr:glycosyltransferase [Bacteroidales bacterium]
MMKFLFLCNKSPWPAHEGGPIAMNSIIQGLLNAGHQVKILAVNSDKYKVKQKDIPTEYQNKTGIELIHINLSVNPLHAFLNLFTNTSYHVQRFISKQFDEHLTHILQHETFDVVQFETVFMAPYISTVQKYSKAKLILRAHNIEHLIWERLAASEANPLKKWYLQHLSRTLKEYELQILDKFDGIAAITPADAGFFKKNTSKPTIDIPFGIDSAKYKPCNLIGDFPSLFHLGSMNWIPNEEGIKWFLEKVWPIVNERHPTLKLYLAGRFMPEWLLKIQRRNVEVVGEVDDAQQFICSKSIAIVPLLSGSGIRIKIIEAMALGKAVVSTSIGAEGISVKSGTDLLLADDPIDFASAIDSLVNNQKLTSELGANARLRIEENYDNRKIIRKYCDWLGKV